MAKMQRNETESGDGLTLTQLATRVPKDLHRVVKVWCVKHDTSVADFVADALRHELEARRAEERESGREPPRKAAAKVKGKPKKRREERVRVFDDDEDYVPDDNDEDAA
jgi:hypothetical protein